MLLQIADHRYQITNVQYIGYEQSWAQERKI
jgi:hypothetical protein